MRFSTAVITVSDKVARGEREDKSGDALEKLLTDFGAAQVTRLLVPDERSQISAALVRSCDELACNLVITTGGTGLGLRDVTPEATSDVLERNAPGFAEAIRAGSLEITPRAMLSRAVSGTRGRSLILNFPGSPKACSEAFGIVEPALAHALELLAGQAGDCAR
jgi:molybdenum cofactor synthesis domain-containing protein